MTSQSDLPRQYSRSNAEKFRHELFEMLRMPAILPATLAIVRPRAPRPFRVTPKGRGRGGRARTIPVPSVSLIKARPAGGLTVQRGQETDSSDGA